MCAAMNTPQRRTERSKHENTEPPLSPTSFFRVLESYKGVNKKQTAKGDVYSINAAELKEYLKSTGRYDKDARL
jgi:hypothetical protein